MLKVYTNTEGKGEWPIGFCAIVVASSRKQAASILRKKMVEYTLDPKSIKAKDCKEVDLETPHALILNNGSY